MFVLLHYLNLQFFRFLKTFESNTLKMNNELEKEKNVFYLQCILQENIQLFFPISYVLFFLFSLFHLESKQQFVKMNNVFINIQLSNETFFSFVMPNYDKFSNKIEL